MKWKMAIIPVTIAFVVGFTVGPGLADWQPGDDHKMHYPQGPKTGGWDVEFAWSRLADDWMCSQTGPVTDIHFWISWMFDIVQPIEGFAVRIWSNNPVGPDGYSVPDNLLWEREFVPPDFTIIEWSSDVQGWLMPPGGDYDLDNHVRRFQVNIEDIQDPFTQHEGAIYWLEIDFGPLNYIGWKETDQNWNDDAVIWFGKWEEIIDPITGGSIDLAFVITGPTEPGQAVSGTVDLRPYFDWCAISSYAGLAPPGNMGIWDPWHKTNFYFPSDSLSPNPTAPKAWLIPGVHLATYYGPANMLIPSNPIVTVPDRSFRPCTLRVEIPDLNLIDEATDPNVIQISAGERKTISMTYFIQPVQTMVLLANCDGGVLSPGMPSPDQPLEVLISYGNGTADTVVIDNIHPAARANNISGFSPSNTMFCKEVFGCGPPYFDLPSPGYDHAHSEFWHWYTLYPDTTTLIDSITFIGIQLPADTADIHILAISYSPCCNHDGIRGDVNYDMKLNVSDLTYLVSYLFKGGPAPPCFEEGDVNGDGKINVSDLTYLVSYLFKAGLPPAPCP